MDQQVSPAVVVIVLILIVAILVGLYFLISDRNEPVEDGASVVPAPGTPDPAALRPTPPPAVTALDDNEAGAEPDTVVDAEASQQEDEAADGRTEGGDAPAAAEPADDATRAIPDGHAVPALNLAGSVCGSLARAV
ncbi:MAG TPA: hypothetical protein DEP45_02875 [Armatimonadetes bacterium]|nr:hypothetical protein [Armatimonadota bacterium]